MNAEAALVVSSAFAMWLGATAASGTWIKPSCRLIGALAILLAGFLLLGEEIWRTISWIAAFPFLVGFALQRFVTICPCGQRDCSHFKAGLVTLVVGLMFVHSLFDGHLLAEFANPLGIGAMLVHKFLDGLALAVLLGGLNATQRRAAIAIAISATPLGLLCLPKGVLGPFADALLVSGILGIYASTAFLIASVIRPKVAR